MKRLHVENEGRIAKVAKITPVGIDLRDQFVIDIELEMVAVGADHSGVESDRFIPARPAEGGFQHNFLPRVALRFVKTRGGLGLAENVSHAVVTNAVAGAEVEMGVVVESAPADAAGVLRIRGELVVGAGVTQSVFSKPFGIVKGLGRIGVSHEFRVQVQRVVRRSKREPKIVDGKHVFEKL